MSREAPVGPRDLAHGPCGCAGHGHLVEFYETEEFLVETVSGFIGHALHSADAAIVVATAAHRDAFVAALQAAGLDVPAAIAEGRYLAFDAEELLATFMVDGEPDAERFAETIGEVIGRASAGGRRVRIYGEMVALLWDAGDVLSAIALEDLWNDLAAEREFALLCAYPMRAFDDEASAEAFKRICEQHTTVIPAEGYSRLDGADQQQRAVAALQQEAAGLRGGISRLHAERALTADPLEAAAGQHTSTRDQAAADRDRAAAARDQTASDRDQSQADADQRTSNRDLAAADRGRAAAARDQRASDRDRAAADRKEAAADRAAATHDRDKVAFEDEVRRRIAERVERERALLTLAEELAGAGSWESDLRAGSLTWSRGMYRLCGRQPGARALTPKDATLGVHPDDRARVALELEPMNATDDDLHSAYRITRPDGKVRHVETDARVEHDSDGVAVRIVGVSLDVTERREIEVARDEAERRLREREQMLSEAEERFRGAFESAPIGMALIGLDGTLLQVNGVLCDITGYPRAQLQTLELQALSHPKDGRNDAEALVSMTRGKLERYSVEKRFLRPDHSDVWVQLQVTLLRDRQGRPVRFIAQVQDISGRHTYEQQLRQMADHDPLTGLLNRRSFEQAIERQLALARRYKTTGVLLFIDLDDFKYVNDSLGHAAGDKLIVLVAGALAAALRDTDIIARLGGDEFAVLLPQADPARAEAVAEKLLQCIAGIPVPVSASTNSKLTASCGIAILDERFATADDVLVAADLTMYDAKESGKNRCLTYSRDELSQPRIKARMTWIDRIKHALADEGAGFVLHAQPILDLQHGRITQHELLVRMLADDGELIMPGTFLYIAERFDLIQELDRVVIGRAIHQLAEPLGSPLSRIAVNVSSKSLADPALPDFIAATIADAGVDPSRVCFEITETAAISNIPLAQEFGARLGKIGCELALDDFGAGFGSFYYLKHLPFDYLKIDGEFITNCLNNRSDQLVIEALVNIAHGLGKRTVAEFVGDEPTLRYLRAHGVDLAQGYHIGRPQARPAESVAATIASA